MTNLIHLIAQYLAAANLSFVPSKPDDSHSNLGFSNGNLYTHALNKNGAKLAFNYLNFSLNWDGKSIALDGKSHDQVLAWLTNTALELEFKTPYRYEFHYQMPYAIEQVSPFKKPDQGSLQQAIARRERAHQNIGAFVSALGFNDPVRIWPHHFDSGTYLSLDWGQEIGLGIGLAIPDAVEDSFYYYMGYYKGHDPVVPDSSEPLSYGAWKTSGFVGAVARQEDISQGEDAHFFNQVHQSFKTKLH